MNTIQEIGKHLSTINVEYSKARAEQLARHEFNTNQLREKILFELKYFLPRALIEIERALRFNKQSVSVKFNDISMFERDEWSCLQFIDFYCQDLSNYDLRDEDPSLTWKNANPLYEIWQALRQSGKTVYIEITQRELKIEWRDKYR